MAGADIDLARSYAQRKSEEWLNKAVDILLESLTEPDDVVNQYLAEEGYTMKVKGEGSRRRMIATLEAAIAIRNGQEPIRNDSHMPSFGHRRIET